MAKELNPRNVGKRLKKAREKQKITKSQMRNLSGLDWNQITSIEEGTKNNTEKTLLTYLNTLGLDISEI